MQCCSQCGLAGAARCSTRSIVMQPGTGQTSQQIAPTHSCSSTLGMRCGGVWAWLAAIASSLAMGVWVSAAGREFGFLRCGEALTVDVLVRAVPTGDSRDRSRCSCSRDECGDDLVARPSRFHLQLWGRKAPGNRRGYGSLFRPSSWRGRRTYPRRCGSRSGAWVAVRRHPSAPRRMNSAASRHPETPCRCSRWDGRCGLAVIDWTMFRAMGRRRGRSNPCAVLSGRPHQGRAGRDRRR